MKRHLLLGAAVALAFGAGLVTQAMVGAQAPVPPKDIIKEEPLVGGNSQDMLMQVVTIAPNAATPWHIHPDGHEITYVLDGAVKIQVDKQPDRVFKTGEGFHINANIVHRGVGEASGAKLLIVRLKPKDKPVMQPVDHTN
jgi:quercetin dioxygenase-like cupin family protein